MKRREAAVPITNIELDELTPVLLGCLNDGQTVVLPVVGNSMAPLLRSKRDQVILAPTDATALHPGDLPLHLRYDGRLVLHRIVERDDGQHREVYGKKAVLPSARPGKRLVYTVMGDSQTIPTTGVTPEIIIAVAVAIVRKGKRIECDSAAYRRRCLFWHRLFPLRGFMGWTFRKLRPILEPSWNKGGK